MVILGFKYFFYFGVIILKKWIIGIAFAIIIISGVGYYLYSNNTSNNSNTYEAERTSTNTDATNNAQSEEQKQAEEVQRQAQAQSEQQQSEFEAQKTAQQPVEAEELSTFSTKIYTKDSGRQNNITITCSALNDTDVSIGETFSFCNTVGRSSPSKGYKKADIFTDGEKTKGYGGGNCQVSTTLYNAVLEVPGLDVTERHEHSNKVPYIKNGKDAAVAYGSYDFKFVNNTDSTIRIKASHTTDSVTIRLIKMQ